MFFNLRGIRKHALVQSQESVESGGGQWGTGSWSLGWVGGSSREGWAGIVSVGRVLRTMTFFLEKGSGG